MFLRTLTILAIFAQNTFIFAQNSTNSKIPKQEVTSTIGKVTLFTNGGQVTRKAKTTLPSGKTELVFIGISPNIDKQSIQVKGDGLFTVLSVSHQLNYLREQKQREEIEVLANRRTDIVQKITPERNLLSVLKSEEELIQKNQVIYGQNVGLDAADLKNALDFQRNRLLEIFTKRTEIEQNLRKINDSIQKIDNQLRALNSSNDLRTAEILVTVSATNATSASFELSYLVRDAAWSPMYDIRVKDVLNPIELAMKGNVRQTSGEDWKEVKLFLSNGNPSESGNAPTLNPWYLRFGYNRSSYEEYQQQETQKLAAKLTTESDMRRGVPYNGNGNSVISGTLTDENGEPLIGVTVTVAGKPTIGTITDIDGNYSLSVPNGTRQLNFIYVGYTTQTINLQNTLTDVVLESSNARLEEVVITGMAKGDDEKGYLAGKVAGAELAKPRLKKERKASAAPTTTIPLVNKESYQPTFIVFEIDAPYTIPTDGKVYTVDIKALSVPTEYSYFAVPKFEKDAFLTAKITDWQDLNLLDGEANLFFEGRYLGKSALDLKNAEDTLSISLGRDKSIQVDRKRLKDYTSKRFLSDYKKESRAFEITIKNNKQQPINITIQDQFPISTTKEITIDTEEIKEANVEKETQKITWKYQIAPRQEKKMQVKYSVKYPSNQTLNIE